MDWLGSCARSHAAMTYSLPAPWQAPNLTTARPLPPHAVFMHDKFNRTTQRADETSMVVVTKTVRRGGV